MALKSNFDSTPVPSQLSPKEALDWRVAKQGVNPICQNNIRKTAKMIEHFLLLFMIPGFGHAKECFSANTSFDDKNAIVYTAGVETLHRAPIADVGNRQPSGAS